MATTIQASILSDAMLRRFAERAPGYDRENRFFTEDFDELKQAGYLACAVPRELGGGGLTFAQVMQEQRRLAYHAPATALAINMHLYWTGVAADLWRAGDKSLEWLLDRRGEGRGVRRRPRRDGATTFPCSSRPRRRSASTAATASPDTRSSAASRRCGPSSACTAWTRATRPRPRSSTPSCRATTEGYSIKETWDVLGMRATASHDTVLEGAFVPDQYIARVVPAGFAGADLFVLAVFAWALTGFANVYSASPGTCSI